MPTPAQAHIIRMLINIGRRRLPRNLEREGILSGLVTGSVETRFHNLPGGDADSENWRQERGSVYGPQWAKTGGSRNLRASINRYYDEYLADAHGVGTIGQQAQAVQQSAFPDRYQAKVPLARRLLRQYGSKGKLHDVGPGIPQLDSITPVGASESVFDTLDRLNQATGMDDPRSESNYALFRALDQEQAPPDIPNLMPALMKQIGQGRGNQGPGGELGKVVGHPIDRAGVPTKPWVIQAARRVAGIYGHPITLGTGTQHNQYTVNGNVSDHWGGEALDLPATGKQLILMGQAALIAAGMKPAQARKINGGLFNINGWQIIFNTQEGGDHTNHLHMHPPRPRRRK